MTPPQEPSPAAPLLGPSPPGRASAGPPLTRQSDSRTDPVTREIVKNALAAAADEMAIALYRTAYSTIVRDCLDYSTSLCDGSGEMIAQGVTIPLHLGSVPFAMETLLAKYGDEYGGRRRIHHERPLRGGHAHPGHLHHQADLLGGSAHRVLRGHRPPPRSGRAAAGQLGVRQHRDLPGGAAHPVAQAVPAGRAGRVAVRDGAGERARAGDDAGGPAGAGGGLPHRRACRARADAPLRTRHLPGRARRI